MFVDALLGDVLSRSLTVGALRKITDSNAGHSGSPAHSTRPRRLRVGAQGVDCGVWYIGSGSGWNGLWSRLGTWFSAFETMRANNVGPDPLVQKGAASWVPAVRAAHLNQLQCYSSSLPQGSDPGAKVWEARCNRRTESPPAMSVSSAAAPGKTKRTLSPTLRGGQMGVGAAPYDAARSGGTGPATIVCRVVSRS